ncbi:MAG: hypothetical protein QM704_25490 [Anaeromyxobacteraceae bacterium]
MIAVVTLREAKVHLSVSDPEFAPLLHRLFEEDFEETVGFPGRLIREKAGTLNAFRAAARYLNSVLGLGVAVQQVASTQAVSSARLSSVEAERMAQAALFVLSARDHERVLQAMTLWRAVMRYKAELALRYGCFKRLDRERRAVEMRRFRQETLVGAPSVSAFPSRVPLAHAGPGAVRPTTEGRSLDDLVAGAVVAKDFLERPQGRAHA